MPSPAKAPVGEHDRRMPDSVDAYREQCDGYLVKPIRKQDILGKLADLGFPS